MSNPSCYDPGRTAIVTVFAVASPIETINGTASPKGIQNNAA